MNTESSRKNTRKRGPYNRSKYLENAKEPRTTKWSNARKTENDLRLQRDGHEDLNHEVSTENNGNF
jgi:hypothetical protein